MQVLDYIYKNRMAISISSIWGWICGSHYLLDIKTIGVEFFVKGLVFPAVIYLTSLCVKAWFEDSSLKKMIIKSHKKKKLDKINETKRF